MDTTRSGTVDLLGACPTLARSRNVRELLKKHFGEDRAKVAIGMMRAGRLDGGFGDEIHDFLSDAIHNEAKVVWDGAIPGSEFEFPVNVNAFGGIFFVWAMEYDPVGYFTSRDDAVSYIFGEWGGVHGKVCR